MSTLLTAGLGTDYSAYAAGVYCEGTFHSQVGGYTDNSNQVAVSESTRFDIASVSKTMVASLLARLVELQRMDLDEPVSRWVDVGSGPGSDHITLRMLATHTSGLPSESHLWKSADIAPEERLSRVLGTELQSAPGAEFRYSCLGYIALGRALEIANGASLPELLQQHIWQPLGMTSTSYGPLSKDRSVATEVQDYVGRGLVHGQVHDELNWWLGGQVGNAGIFSTVGDMLTFSRVFTSPEILGPTAFRLLTTNQLPAGVHAEFEHSVGMRINDATFMGEVSGIGHTGFTGCLLFAQPASGTTCVLLTNRVHPSRQGADPNQLRRRFIAELAQGPSS